MKRKSFLKQIAIGGLAAPTLLQSCSADAGDTAAAAAPTNSKKYRWKMVTTWPPNFPVSGEGAVMLADWIREMSNGRLDIKVFGAGELVPALECFDAVSSGPAEMASSVAYYWTGKSPAAQFFGAVPFGMNAQQVNAWITNGGGMELWRELYAKFNLVPFLGGNTGVQMGGWFNKKINSVEDLRGLKMRIPGLGGRVLEKAGGAAVLSAGGEIYTNLERGVIDATEWVGPYHDSKMGFQKVAKYCYYPGWHEPGSILEIIVNKQKLETLPADLQAIVEAACARLNNWVLGEFEAQNSKFLAELKAEGVEFLPFPDDVLSALRAHTETVIDEVVAEDPFAKRVYDSYQAFRQKIAPWSKITEQTYYDKIG